MVVCGKYKIYGFPERDKINKKLAKENFVFEKKTCSKDFNEGQRAAISSYNFFRPYTFGIAFP